MRNAGLLLNVDKVFLLYGHHMDGMQVTENEIFYGFINGTLSDFTVDLELKQDVSQQQIPIGTDG